MYESKWCEIIALSNCLVLLAPPHRENHALTRHLQTEDDDLKSDLQFHIASRREEFCLRRQQHYISTSLLPVNSYLRPVALVK